MAAAAPAAAAGRGDKWTFLDGGGSVFTTTNCGFPIVATQDVSQVFTKTAKAPDGSTMTLFTGRAVITWTANGKSVTTNTSGPAKITVSADGLTVTEAAMGPEPFDLSPAIAALLGVPDVFVTTGRATATLDPATGNPVSGSFTGHIAVDLCAALR